MCGSLEIQGIKTNGMGRLAIRPTQTYKIPENPIFLTKDDHLQMIGRAIIVCQTCFAITSIGFGYMFDRPQVLDRSLF